MLNSRKSIKYANIYRLKLVKHKHQSVKLIHITFFGRAQSEESTAPEKKDMQQLTESRDYLRVNTSPRNNPTERERSPVGFR